MVLFQVVRSLNTDYTSDRAASDAYLPRQFRRGISRLISFCRDKRVIRRNHQSTAR